MRSIFTTTIFCLTTVLSVFSQNIDDNKVNFQFIQLPLQKINPAYTSYEVRTIHTYKKANEDSLAVFTQRKELAERTYKSQYDLWVTQRKNIDKTYFAQLAQYEKTVNSGVAATMPIAPVYPAAPQFIPVEMPRINADITDAEVNSAMDIKGFTKGLGGSILTINILPIRDIRIIETKTGTGATTKYEYKCQYVLPVEVTFETPTEGALLKKIMFEGIQYQAMKSYPSKYDYLLWLMDNEQQFYRDLERDARKRALSDINQNLNMEFGFVPSTRSLELYSVKKYRDYGYSDFTTAFTLTTQALNLVAKDRNRSSAYDKIDQAVVKWKLLLEESNLIDDKARINDKITAVIYCNLAELLMWRGDFDQAELYNNLALNSGVMKARNHAERMVGFYADQRKRWQIHF
jgi:hypothetical protein